MSAGQNKSAKLEGAGGEWQEKTLGEILILQRGFDLPETDRQLGRYLVIASNGPVGKHSKAMVKGPGVVIGRSGNLGGGQYIKEDFWPLNTTLWVKDFKNNDIRFCYYLLKSLDLSSFNSGSGVPTLNRNHIHPLPVSIPNRIEEQRAIAHILGTLDDKIELNRRTNETLEAMAQALFKFWFVDFGPVRAKMEGRWRRGQSLPGLPAHLFDLFPDRLVDSELGEIPKGWEVSQFANTIEIIGGGTPKTSVAEYWGDEIPWFSVADTPSKSDMWVMDTEKKVTHKGIENSSTKILPIGTTIISARGTVGKVALVGIPMAMNQSCYGLCGKMGTQGIFNYFVIRELISVLQQNAHGSVFDTITRDTLGNITVVTPPLDIIDKFEIYTITLTNSIRENLNQSHTLATIRDTLLPKLISGKLRVKQTREEQHNGD